MIEKISKILLHNRKKIKTVIPLSNLNEGLIQLTIFSLKKEKNEIKWVVNRMCDHIMAS